MSSGDAGRQWLASLDDLLSDCQRMFGLAPVDHQQFLQGGSESLVLPVIQEGTGHAAILKLLVPTGEPTRELMVYRLAAGQGYARLLDADEDRGAMLLERLGPSLGSQSKDVSSQIQVLVTAMMRGWTISVPDNHGLLTGDEKLSWLADYIRERLPGTEQPLRETVEAYLEERMDVHAAGNSRLVHGDGHADNLLMRTDTDDFVWVDPDGLFAEPACDLAVSMREWNDEYLEADIGHAVISRCTLLSELTEVSPRSIWQWGAIERVSTALALDSLGLHDDASGMLRVAVSLVKDRHPFPD